MNKRRRPQQHKPGTVTVSKLTFHQLDWLEYTTIGLGLWFIYFREPYTVLFTLLLIIPVLGLVLNGLTGRPSISSLVEITKDDYGTDTYDVADFIDLAAWVLLLRVLIDFEVESFYSLIIPGIVACVLMLIVLFVTHDRIVNTTKSKTWIYTSLIFNICLYSFAAVYGINCVYDDSEPTVYQAGVVGKSISTGSKGRKTYYIEVTPWGHHYDKEEISVSQQQYENLRVGQTVRIDLKQGVFHIPWYYIE